MSWGLRREKHDTCRADISYNELSLLRVKTDGTIDSDFFFMHTAGFLWYIFARRIPTYLISCFKEC